MKKVLLTALLAFTAGAAFAQSKTTGTVTLTTGMTAKVDLNSGTSTATLTLTGPQDRWIALQFGSFATGGGMQDGTDVVYYNGTTLIDANQNGIGSAPSTDTNDWTVTSNTVSGTTRTIVATRAFAGGTGDFTFNYTDANIDFAWARGSSASFSLSNHGSNRGYKLNQAFNCLAPNAPTAEAQSFCSPATVSQLTATGEEGATFSWYQNATGGTALTGTTALSSATYYVSQTQSACESTRTPVVVTVTSVPEPGGAIAQTLCNGATIQDIAVTLQDGASVSWYESNSATTPISSFATIGSGTYYVSQTQGNCTSTRKAVTVTLDIPALPGAAGNQSFCEGATVAELVATGTNLKWYLENSGTPLAQTATLTNGVYYVTQTPANCESEIRTVNVTINPIPAGPGAAPAQTFDAGETVADLQISIVIGSTVQWYTLNGTTYTAIPSTTALVSGTTYYVTQTLNGCESDYTAVTATAAAGTATFTISGLKAYPNPVSGIATISANNSLAAIQVHNLLGQQVLAQKASGNSAEINMAQLSAGTYIVKVTADNGATATVRVVKQ
ncbi:T9SS type A sorting domain-containing protein [Flavobacterium sp. RHBU_24]|uniref:T9SS type A sorting domain-containing protein n=1 Tax=Flavobacterium sp. RHBU_24 TaxID=3391185 RepID=UPI003984776E